MFNTKPGSVLRDKTARPAEPLMFRDMRESLMNLPALDTPPQANAPEAIDLPDVIQAAEEEARREAHAKATADCEIRIQAERESIHRAVRQFEQEKQDYFANLEQEVVKLALAIAERVLHRESSMDPMLLAGAARVALEQIAEGSEAVLHVSAEDVSHWNQAVLPTSKTFTIEPDQELSRGECVLKTRSGTVQLGLKAQLQEIERGFFELMGRRPTMAGAC